VFVNSDGRLEVFARGTDGALWHVWQEAPHAGPWSGWASLGGVITSDPVAIDNSDGRLEVFARGTDSAVWHIWQQAPHAGPWSGWASLGGSVINNPL
jgi:acylphosphatase